MPHQRRKSGHGLTQDSRRSVTASDSKHVRPSMPRRYTPSTIHRHTKNTRDRHESSDEESFPQFCMSCEKQFLPHGDYFLYCSESCRRSDQASKSTYHSYNSTADYSSSRNNSYASDASEPKDIIPQASPSRPGSMIFASSPPATPGNHYHESAVSALRSLSHARRPPSPPSPTNTTGFWPFGGKGGAAPSPSASYVRPSAGYLSSSNYDAGYYGGSGGFAYSGPTDHRPLPSRSSRPKSVELVTPIIGR